MSSGATRSRPPSHWLNSPWVVRPVDPVVREQVEERGQHWTGAGCRGQRVEGETGPMGSAYYRAESESGDHIEDLSEDALFMLIGDLNDSEPDPDLSGQAGASVAAAVEGEP